MLLFLVLAIHVMAYDIQKSIFRAVDQLSLSIEGSLETKISALDHDSQTIQSTIHHFRSTAPAIIQSNFDSFERDKKSMDTHMWDLRSFYVAQTVNDLQTQLAGSEVKSAHTKRYIISIIHLLQRLYRSFYR